MVVGTSLLPDHHHHRRSPACCRPAATRPSTSCWPPLLLAGGIVGAQFGARASSRFRAEELRAILALIVLLVGLRMGLGLFLTPDEPFVLMSGMGG